MLTNIKVNGFRSLVDFQIELRDGLNVLVGANGTGKSNFISFLDFAGVLVGNGLNSAIAVAQGAGAVFSKETFAEDNAELEFVLSGEVSLSSEDDIYHRTPIRGLRAKYKYKCRINYIRSIPAVYISYESIETSVDGKDRLEIIRSTNISGVDFKTSVSMLPKNHPISRDAFRWLRQVRDTKFDINEYLSSNAKPDQSILRSLASEYLPFMMAVKDLMGYRSINIDPAIARKPTPVGSGARLLPTGEGLAGVLYQLQQGTYQPASYMYYRPSEPADAQRRKFESIMSWCREVNPDIINVTVGLDFFEAQLKPAMTFEIGGFNQSFPLSRISDGTVKWLALTSILFMDEDLSVIEEPENFLHPFMQEAFVGLCRHIISSKSDTALLVSTHSPTLLDCCAPSELTIFETVGGHTRASRVKNRDELATKIAKSRFGLGYYYRIGGVYGEDRSAS